MFGRHLSSPGTGFTGFFFKFRSHDLDFQWTVRPVEIIYSGLSGSNRDSCLVGIVGRFRTFHGTISIDDTFSGDCSGFPSLLERDFGLTISSSHFMVAYQRFTEFRVSCLSFAFQSDEPNKNGPEK